MELLRFGHGGARVLVFPTRGGRFFDYENWGLVDVQRDALESGTLQLFCVDSVDYDALYALHLCPRERLRRHVAYENYLLHEVLPLTATCGPSEPLIAHGCSLGAYHAVTLALRHPHLFTEAIGLSGRYNLTERMGNFPPLLDPNVDHTVHYFTPPWFMAGICDVGLLKHHRRLRVYLGVGEEDVFLTSNRELRRVLTLKGVDCSLDVHPGEAHRARHWVRMMAGALANRGAAVAA